jgi:hypothetical protein
MELPCLKSNKNEKLRKLKPLLEINSARSCFKFLNLKSPLKDNKA